MKGRLSVGNQMSRRQLVKGSAAAAAAMFAAGAEPRSMEGYTDQLSYQAEDEVRFHISTSAKAYDIEIAREGAVRELVWDRRGVLGSAYPAPASASTHGCGWPAAFTLRVPEQWRSGYYTATMRAKGSDDADQGKIFFVVRSAHPGRDSKILLQLCTNTYNAYNTYGGLSLYSGYRKGAQVSFDRPYAGFAEPKGFTAKYSGWQNWEKPFVEWAERAGYRIDFAVNSDLEIPGILKNYRLVLSVGHDEYWSSAMRDNLEGFIAKGGNVAFFSGNTAFWQVRPENSGRILVGWKDGYEEDPFYAQGRYKLLSTMWSNRLVERPENELTGVSFAWGGYHHFFDQVPDGLGAYEIHRPDHWIFAGTGLRRGDLLGAKGRVVGYECDGCEFVLKNRLPVATHRDGTPESFEILGTAPAGLSTMDNSLAVVTEALYGKNNSQHRHPQPGAAVLGNYTRGGTVFTTGCTDWSNGLKSGDEIVERITRNVLDRLSS